MKLHQLRDFVAVASSGSLRSAAKVLNLTQPSLTKSIQQLEKEFGRALFDREPRGVVLSAAGKAFLPRAKAVLNELQRAASEIKQLGGAEGSVNMAISTSVSLTVLPAAITEYKKKFPFAPIRVASGAYSAMLSEMRSGLLDFSIGPRPLDLLPDEFEVEMLFTNTRAVICRKGHPLRNATSLTQLMDSDWLVSGAFGATASEHDQIFPRLGMASPKSVVHCDYSTAVFSLLNSTDMLTIMPNSYASPKNFGGAFVEIPVKESLPGAEIVLIRRAGMPLTPSAEYMLTLLRRHIEYDVVPAPSKIPKTRPR